MNNVRMKVKDSQFARFFLTNEINLKSELVDEVLNYEIEVKSGEPDTVFDRGDTLIVNSPSSLTRFLFNVLYTSLSKFVQKDVYKDKLGLGLLYMCKDYVYADYEPRVLNGPPVLVDFQKMSVPYYIIKEIVEPIVGTIDLQPVFFIKCKFTDTCRIVKSSENLSKQYDLPRMSVNNSDFPLILCNAAIQNSPAESAHLLVKTMEMSLGEQRSKRALKNILTDESSNLMSGLCLIVKTLRGEPDFLINFLKYLGSSVKLTGAETDKAESVCASVISGDTYLSQKIARDTQVFRQWSQWSMLMGLIEKQLTPMRGSMWPASETIKPTEDAFRAELKNRALKKGKTQLNFEELLESYRDIYDRDAVEPSKILEHVMRKNRVWK